MDMKHHLPLLSHLSCTWPFIVVWQHSIVNTRYCTLRCIFVAFFLCMSGVLIGLSLKIVICYGKMSPLQSVMLFLLQLPPLLQPLLPLLLLLLLLLPPQQMNDICRRTAAFAHLMVDFGFTLFDPLVFPWLTLTPFTPAIKMRSVFG